MSATSSGPCGRSIGRPTVSVPRVLRVRGERHGDAVGRQPEPDRSGHPGEQPGQPGAQLGRPGQALERRAQLGEPILVGVGEGGQPEPARLVDQVHRAPGPEPGDDDLRHDRDGQLDVE